MEKLRNIATAFLMNENDFLLMKRSEQNELMPGFWYGVGGHVEPEELNHPMTACLREIEEETGIKEHDITDLKLKYIIMRRSGDEIVMNYIYFGYSKTRTVVENGEGTLHWIPRKDVLNRLFIDALRLTLAHYMEPENQTEDVLAGVVFRNQNHSEISWNPLQDMKDLI